MPKPIVAEAADITNLDWLVSVRGRLHALSLEQHRHILQSLVQDMEERAVSERRMTGLGTGEPSSPKDNPAWEAYDVFVEEARAAERTMVDSTP